MKPANHAPIYAACCYPKLAEICRKHGYALAAHGSLAKDFDLICIPWIERPSSPERVVAEIIKNFAVHMIGEPETKLHGRLVVMLSWMGGAYMDLSFMPIQ